MPLLEVQQEVVMASTFVLGILARRFRVAKKKVLFCSWPRNSFLSAQLVFVFPIEKNSSWRKQFPSLKKNPHLGLGHKKPAGPKENGEPAAPPVAWQGRSSLGP